jgi:alpha-beta hydrolase superfamily lysophospholipase
MNRTAYYLPGAGGQITTGLGEGLTSRGWAAQGRETIGDFRKLPFQEQVDTIAEDLRQMFWREDAHVVAVSFGAYLFLHAQAQLPPFPGNVLLLSPIVGQFSSEEIGLGFIPPRADKLKKLADGDQFPTPLNCQIHVGSEDWQSNPENVLEFSNRLGIPVTVVPGLGHQLGKEYVGSVLDRWLGPLVDDGLPGINNLIAGKD